MFYKLHQPVVFDCIEEAADIRVQQPTHLPLRDRHIDCVQSVVLTSARAKPIAETEKALLVNLLEDQHQCLLDDLIFHCGHTKRTLPTIGLGNPDPLARFGPIAAAVDAIPEVDQTLIQPLAVLRSRHSIHPGGRISSETKVRLPEQISIHVVQQVGKLLLRVLSRCLPYPVQSARR